MDRIYQIGWFSTGRDKAAGDLLQAVQDKIKAGKIPAEIAFVFCSRQPGETKESDLFLNLVEDYHIPIVSFSYQRFKAEREATSPKSTTLPRWRLEYDREVMARLKSFNPDLCVLAGYMLIVGREMCSRYDMINLHPAAPGGPSGTWQEVIWQLISNKAEQSGVMMHLVTPELDKGPPVAYCTFPVRGKPFDRYWQEIDEYGIEEIKEKEGENNRLFRLIREHGLMREFPLIIATIKAFSQGKVRVVGGRVVDAEEKPITGYNLTGEINEQVRRTNLEEDKQT